MNNLRYKYTQYYLLLRKLNKLKTELTTLDIDTYNLELLIDIEIEKVTKKLESLQIWRLYD